MTITNDAEYRAAQRRINQLTLGDFVDPGDVDELKTLLMAATTWEVSAHSGEPSQRLAIPITSVEEYEAATARAQDLKGCIEGSPEEAELADISNAIMAWDVKHDDATAWKDQEVTSPNVFDRVDEEPEDAVTVILMDFEGVTLADVSWPFQAVDGRLEGPMLGNPREPRAAFNHAFDMQQKLGLARVVVQLSEGARWDSEWGTLRG